MIRTSNFRVKTPRTSDSNRQTERKQAGYQEQCHGYLLLALILHQQPVSQGHAPPVTRKLVYIRHARMMVYGEAPAAACGRLW